MKIELTTEIAATLTARAEQRGLTPEQLANEMLRDQLHELSGSNQVAVNGATAEALEPEDAEDEFAEGTLYDALKDYIGTVKSSEFVPGGAQMSQDCGHKFTEILLEKKRRGKI